jgi:hypothetical protein
MSLTFTIYKANYNPIPSHLDVDALRDVFDQGNPTFDRYEQLTANGKFERIVHRSLEHLYYRDFYTNNKASFGSGHIKKQERRLKDKAYVISMPQSKFGESILPGSVKINIDYSFMQYTASAWHLKQGTWTVVDDSFGNLYVSGSNTNSDGYYYETPLGAVGGAETNYSSSISKTKPLVGEWPFDGFYKFVDLGPINYTSSYDRGFWPLQTRLNNVSIVDVQSLVNQGRGRFTGPVTPYPHADNYLDFGMSFDGSTSASFVELVPAVSSDYKQKYNFENGDFTIYLDYFIDSTTTAPTDCVLIAKEGPEDDIRVDKDGNIHRSNTSTKVPWKISLVGGYPTFKCQSGAEETYSLSATQTTQVGFNSLVVTKSGSLITIEQSSGDTTKITTTGIKPFADKITSNKANIFVGNSYKKDEGFTGVISNVKIYKGALDQYERKLLINTCGAGNIYVGNVFYNHGMMTLTATPTQWTDVTAVECRGTHTIWENEVSCTVAPGEFGMSSNPTLQEYSTETDQYEYRSFVTGSSFKPFITTIGLYDNLGRLLVIGKLSTPIQTPDNTDTTFIVRYDR